MTLDRLILPFIDLPVKIGQGFNGRYTHKKIRPSLDQSYAVDFILPLGSEVFASKPGRIKFVESRLTQYYEGLDFEKGKHYYANFVELEHSDGTFSCFQHFAPDRITVTQGEHVAEGQLLGYTGKSGWLGPEPHLHFSLYERKIQKRPLFIQTLSLPFSYRDYHGPLEDSELNESVLRKGYLMTK